MAANLVQALSVVLLLARDTRQTADFYINVLGIPLKPEEHDGRHLHFACPFGPLYITVQPAEDMQAPDVEQKYDFLQLCFTVADLDAFMAHLDELQVQPLHPPMPFEHTTFVTLLDPEGRHVRVMTPWDE